MTLLMLKSYAQTECLAAGVQKYPILEGDPGQFATQRDTL